MLENMLSVLPAALIVLLVIVIVAAGYVKAPPDIAFVISGFKKAPRILVGRAGIRIPYLERLDKLLLKQVTIDVKTEDYIPTLNFINVKVDAVVKIRVSAESEMIRLAMRNFLNKALP